MKNYIVSLSKRALLLSGALAIFTACDDGDLGDIYKGNSSGEYVSDVNWTDAADKSTGTYIKYFYENASGRDTFCGSIYWEKPNTPETGEPASTGGSGGWSQGHALDIVIDAYIRHANNPEYQAHLYENIMNLSCRLLMTGMNIAVMVVKTSGITSMMIWNGWHCLVCGFMN